LPPQALIINIDITDMEAQTGRFSIFSHDNRVHQVPVANSGDEVQTFPGIQFMPYLSDTVDRDKGLPTATGHLFGNAWMGARFDFPPNLDVLNFTLFSVHYSGQGPGVVQNNVEWFKSYNEKTGLVGARDHGTLKILRDKGIDVYFSGCFTLMMSMKTPKADMDKPKHIIVVDVAKENLPLSVHEHPDIEYFQSDITPRWRAKDHTQRMEYAFDLLEAYKTRALVVITSRIHAFTCNGTRRPRYFCGC